MTLHANILDILARHRLPLSQEKPLQEEIGKLLTAAGLIFRREVDLGEGDIVDFMVLSDLPYELSAGPAPGIAIEVKIGGGRRSIFRQLERYCAHDAVEQIILATSVFMSLPPAIGGKPAFVAALGRGWL